ncbi:MAG: DUF4363 family protein [Ruminococcaceae bacterium]|nr:DUF4363 family protein [Oscillospiraceae bacterium]
MKAFWASLLLFGILLGGILCNARYLHRTADYLEKTAQALAQADSRDETLGELERFWEKNQTIISLTVGFRELDRFGEIIVQLRWAHDAENESEFERYRLLLADVTEEIIRSEEFSIKNLF